MTKKRQATKNYYIQQKQEASVNCPGVLVSCVSGREREAANEAINVLTEYIELLEEQGKAAPTLVTNNNNSIENEMDAELKALRNKKQQHFVVQRFKVNGLIFLKLSTDNRYNSCSPSSLVTFMMEDMSKTRQCKTRNCLKFLPIDVVCKANINDIKQQAKQMQEQHFIKDGTGSLGVEYMNKMGQKFDRLEIINAFMDLIPCPPYKVQLSMPDRTILAIVVGQMCGISVVAKFQQYGKYNVRSFISEKDQSIQAQEDLHNISNINQNQNDQQSNLENLQQDNGNIDDQKSKVQNIEKQEPFQIADENENDVSGIETQSKKQKLQ